MVSISGDTVTNYVKRISCSLLRNLMRKGAAHAEMPLVEMSFKETLDAVTTNHPLFRGLGAPHRKRSRLSE